MTATAVAVAVPGPWRQCVELARKDIRAELRAGEALLVTAPFGAVALLLMPLAIDSDAPLLRQVGPGMYWLVVLLFGVLVTLRASAVDGPAHLDLLRLSGAGPEIRLAGRALANTVLLLAFQTLLAPVAIALYDLQPAGWLWLLPMFPLVAIGLAVLGALADALAQGLAGRTTLGPLLVAPVSLPLLLAATQVPQAARFGAPPWPWLLLAVTVDLTLVLLALGCVRYLEEAS